MVCDFSQAVSKLTRFRQADPHSARVHGGLVLVCVTLLASASYRVSDCRGVEERERKRKISLGDVAFVQTWDKVASDPKQNTHRICFLFFSFPFGTEPDSQPQLCSPPFVLNPVLQKTTHHNSQIITAFEVVHCASTRLVVDLIPII